MGFDCIQWRVMACAVWVCTIVGVCESTQKPGEKRYKVKLAYDIHPARDLISVKFENVRV